MRPAMHPEVEPAVVLRLWSKAAKGCMAPILQVATWCNPQLLPSATPSTAARSRRLHRAQQHRGRSRSGARQGAGRQRRRMSPCAAAWPPLQQLGCQRNCGTATHSTPLEPC